MRRDIRAVLERWGRWAAHEENRSDWPAVCATFRGVLPHKSSLRPSCCDDDGMAVDACVSQLHRAGADTERAVLYLHYVTGLSLRDIADVLETNRMNVRSLLASGENFVNGCLCAYGVGLEMDLVLAATRGSSDLLTFGTSTGDRNAA
ncbi:antitermination protein Q [Salmonella enterica]|nr:antitermination protein Q [Salmonella enterica]EAS1319778.1 antitermination protein Q [Salmonella enterica]ECX4882119.1 antitermination protein Q [Salmonella enterica]